MMLLGHHMLTWDHFTMSHTEGAGTVSPTIFHHHQMEIAR